MLKCFSISFILLAYLVGCGSRYADQHDSLAKLVAEYRPELKLSEYKVCLIVPSEGCLECIIKTRNFAKENLSNRNILIVANTTSRKMLMLNWTSAELSSPNVVIDSKDLAHVHKLISTGPALFLFDRGVLKNYQLINNATDTKKLFEIVEDYATD